jgi:hypothetical protein
LYKDLEISRIEILSRTGSGDRIEILWRYVPENKADQDIPVFEDETTETLQTSLLIQRRAVQVRHPPRVQRSLKIDVQFNSGIYRVFD